jgi:predicted XRE-type DNA-binding protein
MSDKAVKDDVTVTEGSGNIFADLGLADPDLALAKAELAIKISETIKSRGLTQTRAAALMGVDQPKVSAITRGRLTGYTVDRLMLLLGRLGQPVKFSYPAVVVKKARPRQFEAGRFSAAPRPLVEKKSSPFRLELRRKDKARRRKEATT